MRKIDDQKYLKTVQYSRADGLNARIALHERFGCEENPWFQWVYQKLSIEPGMRILEVGCGPARLWLENLKQLPAGVEITLMDLSAGMVATALEALNNDARFSFITGDVQSLPFPEGHFDRVIANHMLYHVPNIAFAVRELSRVLKPGGVLCASTNGKEHLHEFFAWIGTVGADPSVFGSPIRNYSLENAVDVLNTAFARVEVIPKPSYLWVTEVEPLIAYLQSMWSVDDLDADAIRTLRQNAQAEIDAQGGMYITRMPGALLAWKPSS